MEEWQSDSFPSLNSFGKNIHTDFIFSNLFLNQKMSFLTKSQTWGKLPTAGESHTWGMHANCKLQICPSIHSLFPSLTHMHAGTQAHMHTHTCMCARTHTHIHRLLISLNVAHLFQTVQECCHAHVKPEMTTVLMLSKHYHRVLMCKHYHRVLMGKVFKISSSRT